MSRKTYYIRSPSHSHNKTNTLSKHIMAVKTLQEAKINLLAYNHKENPYGVQIITE